MAVFHLAVKVVSRAKGQSAVAAAAYRTGTRLRCERTGAVIDYRRRYGVVATRTLLPGGIARDREVLWNAVEAAEKRCNSTVAREFELALPAELSPEQREALALVFGRLLVNRYGIVVDLAIHAPSPLGDQRNVHVHIMTSTRVLDEFGQFGAKVRVLDDQKTGPAEITALRERWGSLCNEALAAAGSAVRVDHRSHAQRGVVALPGAKLGVCSTGYERRTGTTSERRLRQQAQRAELEETIERAVAREEEAERKARPANAEVAAARRNAPAPDQLAAKTVSLTVGQLADRDEGRWRGRRTISLPMPLDLMIDPQARPGGQRSTLPGMRGAEACAASVAPQATGASRDAAAKMPSAARRGMERPAVGGAYACNVAGGINPTAIQPLSGVPLMLDAAETYGVSLPPVQNAVVAQKAVVPTDPHPAAECVTSSPAMSASVQHAAAADDQLLRSVLGALRAHYAAETRAMVIAMGASTAAPQRGVGDTREGGPMPSADTAVQASIALDVRRQPAAVAHIAPEFSSVDAAEEGRRKRPDHWAARTTGLLQAVGSTAFSAAEARGQARSSLRSKERAREAGAGTPVETVVPPPARAGAVAPIRGARHGPPSHDARGGVESNSRYDPSRRHTPPGTERRAPLQRDALAAPSGSEGLSADHTRQPRAPEQPSASARTKAGSLALERDAHGTGGSGGNTAAPPDGETRHEAPAPQPSTTSPPVPSCSPEDLYTACVELGAWLLRLRGNHRHEAALLAIMDAARSAVPAQTCRSAASLTTDATRFREEVARHVGVLASVSVDRITRRVAMLVAATGHADLRRLFDLNRRRLGPPGPNAVTPGRDASTSNAPGKPDGRGRD